MQREGTVQSSGQDGDRALMSAREAGNVSYRQQKTMESPVSNPGGLRCETVDPLPQGQLEGGGRRAGETEEAADA